MKVLYKKIVDIEIWHDYYLGQPNPPQLPASGYDISDMLTLVPTPECLRVLRNLRWIFRPQPQGASIFAHVEAVSSGDFVTVLPVNRPERLTFWLVVRDRYFANFTNLPLNTNRHQIYYFSNLSGNQGHALFLTQPLSSYAANSEYHLGQLVDGDGKTLEALHYQASASKNPNANDWDILPNSQYVSERDRLSKQGLSHIYTIPKANPGDTWRLTLVNVNQQITFALDVTTPDNHTPGEAIACNLNFSGQIPGRYQLCLNNIQVEEFVLCDPITSRDAFALVEIVLNQSLVPPAFSLLQPQDGNTLIQPKTYVIRCKNRSTRWRYRYEKPHGFSAASLPNFELIDAKTYATKRPLGLRLQPDRLLTDGKDQQLPAPAIALIQPETDAKEQITTIFSDIHL
ncbi:MAG: hypothetical protein RMX68_016585 [Aulosira sp. ZfuVER01]|nr:hypothetical protein [Aulosira sp. ZfuVER01]MDZ8000845.1 hypothetical protein [Aulosira sp. DedVER01a]MDZ8055884.1 hypothetical protein [Aulosira sp. ZfuCHP01]